ncbi:MAG: DUF3426 domain-containing protein [Methylovulum sp.]|nr:DUF3426 domain-containing protein [Methylovulum sp.]
MFTQCPNCHQKQPLTVEQLRNSKAIAHCSQCGIMFDALELINETVPDSPKKDLPQFGIHQDKPSGITKATIQKLPWENPLPHGKTYWRTGVFLGLLMLISQATYFEGYALSQNVSVRPSLERLCQHLNCRLPAYQNPDELTVMHGALSPLPDKNYEFRAIINNQAAFTQRYPNLNLSLLDYTGKPFTHRVFRPQDYLPQPSKTSTMEANATLDITLYIAATKNLVGGYTFDLSY